MDSPSLLAFCYYFQSVLGNWFGGHRPVTGRPSPATCILLAIWKVLGFTVSGLFSGNAVLVVAVWGFLFVWILYALLLGYGMALLRYKLVANGS